MKVRGTVKVDRPAPVTKPRPPERPTLRKATGIALAVLVLALVVRRLAGRTSC